MSEIGGSLWGRSLQASVQPESPFLNQVQNEAVAAADQEISAVEHLIEVTKKNLQMQRELKNKMELFVEQKERFKLGEHSKQHAALMVQNAREIDEMISAYHLEYLFTSQYLEELAFFSSIARKKTPRRL